MAQAGDREVDVLVAGMGAAALTAAIAAADAGARVPVVESTSCGRPGPGATIAPYVVFGYRAGRDAAARA